MTTFHKYSARDARFFSLCLATLVVIMCVCGGCSHDGSNYVELDDSLVTEPTATPLEAPTPDAATPSDVQTQKTEPETPLLDEKGVALDLRDRVDALGGFVANHSDKTPGVKVVRGNGKLDAKTLEALANFPNLTEFLWQDAQMEASDAALDAFHRLVNAPKLKKIRLSGLTFVSDESSPNASGRVLEELAKSPNLVELDLSGSTLSESDFLLGSQNRPVVDAESFPKLERLNLYGVAFTDQALETLAPLADALTWLNLDQTSITPASAKTLEKFSNLTFLHVGRTTFDDSTIESLATLKNLQKIHVTRTNVTEQGVEKLQNALPQCQIVSVPEN